MKRDLRMKRIKRLFDRTWYFGNFDIHLSVSRWVKP